MKEKVKVVRKLQKELFRRVQELSRSRKLLWNELMRLLPKVHLGYDHAQNDRWLVLREKHRDGDRRVFVDLKTGKLTGHRNLILAMDPKLLDPRHQIATLKKLIRARSSTPAQH